MNLQTFNHFCLFHSKVLQKFCKCVPSIGLSQFSQVWRRKIAITPVLCSKRFVCMPACLLAPNPSFCTLRCWGRTLQTTFMLCQACSLRGFANQSTIGRWEDRRKKGFAPSCLLWVSCSCEHHTNLASLPWRWRLIPGATDRNLLPHPPPSSGHLPQPSSTRPRRSECFSSVGLLFQTSKSL